MASETEEAEDIANRIRRQRERSSGVSARGGRIPRLARPTPREDQQMNESIIWETGQV